MARRKKPLNVPDRPKRRDRGFAQYIRNTNSSRKRRSA